MAGPNGTARKGDVIIVSDKEGKELVDGGYGVIIEEKKTIKEPEIKKQAPVKIDKKDKVKKDGK